MTLAKADAALRGKEGELGALKAKYQTLKAELTAVKQSLSSSRERSDKLEEEGQVRKYSFLCFSLSFPLEGFCSCSEITMNSCILF